MLDPANFQMPEPRRDVKCPRLGEPLFHQLPPVYQQVSKGPGKVSTVCVSEARLYLDDVSTQQGVDNGSTDCQGA